MRDITLSTAEDAALRSEASPYEAVSRWLVARDWPLALLGDVATERLIRSMLGSRDARTVLAALGQVDRLDDWHEIIERLLDDPSRERLALIALASAPRLVGPYVETALREALRRRTDSALATDDPVEALWSVGLDAARWLRFQPKLDAVSLATPDRAQSLTAAIGRLRDLVRACETTGLTPSLRDRAARWPNDL